MIHSDISFEINGNTAVHSSIQVTGSENPAYSQAAEFNNGQTNMLTTSALVYLSGGWYVESVLRASAGVDATLHHFNFYVQRIAN